MTESGNFGGTETVSGTFGGNDAGKWKLWWE